MANRKQNWWKPFVAFSVLTALFVVGSVFVLTPHKAAAAPLTQSQIQDCYQSFNNKDIIAARLAPSDLAKYNTCRGGSACTDTGAGKDIDSRHIVCINPNAASADAAKNAEAALTKPLVAKACGSAPAGEAAQAVFQKCADAVRSTFQSCRYTGGGVTSNMQDTPSNIASCYVNKARSNGNITIKVNKSTAQTAIEQGIADGNGILLADAKDRSGGSNTSDDAEIQYECGNGPTQLSWWMCPLYNAINGVVGGLDDMINSLLTVDQSKIFDTTKGSSGEGFYKAWQTFRAFALALIAIAGLVMIIAHALGFEMLDAYTIKKILPRLLIAVIAIALSWQLMKFFVVLTNDVGYGIRQIIYAPFLDMPGALNLGGGAVVIGALVGSGAAIALGAMGLLSLVATAALAVGVAFLVLIVRQLVIVLLVLFAPIAIACSILPNTNSAFKLWHESFTKALMMFPIITAFIAIGRVFSVVATQGAVGGFAAASSINQLIGFAAYILPYFLIPMTFSLAGGAMRAIGGRINDTNRGAFDRLKKYRGAKVQTNMHAMKEGNRFRDNNVLTRGFNRATHGIAMAPSAGLNPLLMRSRYNAARQQHAFDAAEEIRTKNADFALGKEDDRLLRAVQGKGRDDIRRRLIAEGFQGADLDTAVGTVERMQHAGSREAVLQAAAIQRFATGTGYTKKDKDGNEYFDYQEAMDTISQASGGESGLAGRMLGVAKGESARAGQLAFGGASYGTLAGELNRSLHGGKVNGKKIALNAFEGNDGASIARARAVHVREMYEAASQRINELRTGTGEPPRDPGELGRLTAQIESSAQLASMYGAPERQTAANNALAGSDTARDSVKLDISREDYAAVYDIKSGERISPQSVDNVQYKRNASTRGGRVIDPNDPRMQDRDAS
jgi:hypothetical protein